MCNVPASRQSWRSLSETTRTSCSSSSWRSVRGACHGRFRARQTSALRHRFVCARCGDGLHGRFAPSADHAGAPEWVHRTIDRQPGTVADPAGVESLHTLVFTPEPGIARFPPVFGASPTNPPLPENLTQPFERDRRHDLLLDQMGPELRQRPDVDVDELPGRGQGDFGGLFGHVGHGSPGPPRRQ